MSLCLAFSKKRFECFEEKTCYFVYTNSGAYSKPLTDSCDHIKGLGGAGIVYKHKETYYLIASVYSELSDAEEVKNNITEFFPECGVLKIQTKRASKAVRNSFKANENALLLLNYFNELCTETQNLSMEYLAGKLTENAYLVKLLGQKLELETKIHELDAEKEPFTTFLNHMNLCKVYYDDLFNIFLESTKKDSLSSLLPVRLALLKIELMDSLQI